MLVLSRKIGEKIVIDGGIVLTVVEIKGRQVRLGIEAGSDVRIWRGELQNRHPRAALPRRELVTA